MSTLTYNVACLPHNIDLNRFRNIYPCKRQQSAVLGVSNTFMFSDDDTRVKLTEIAEELGSDYINASLVSVRGFSVKLLFPIQIDS